MRVLHVGKYYPPFSGGMEHFIGDLLPSLAQRGIEVAALVHDHSAGGLAPVESVDGAGRVSVYRVPSYGRLLYAPVSPRFPVWLKRVTDDFKPDIVHLHLPNTSAFWALVLPGLRRLPWVIHWHADILGAHPDRTSWLDAV